MVEAPEAESGDPAETTGQAESEPEEPVPVEISIKKSASQKVWLGEMYQVKVPGKKISDCKSASKKIATVTKGGLITPKKPGKVKITVTLSNKKKLTLTLNVADPTVPASVAIDEGGKRTVAVGDAFQLNAVVSPQTAPQAVSWSSSKEAVAAVDAEGLVTPLKPGRAVITAATANKKAPTKSQLKSVCSFCRKNGIRMVSMYAKWWKADYEALLSAYGLESSVHHVDKRSAAKKFFDQGVTAVYTNFLPPEI